MQHPVATRPQHLPADLEREWQAAQDYAAQEKADNTRRSYRSSMAIFAAWCDARGLLPLPATPVAVASFLAAQAEAGVKPSTLALRAAAISYAHRLKGHVPPPTESEQVRVTMRGIRRARATAPERKAPAQADQIVHMARLTPDTLTGLRDRALLLVGFAGAFRRSELVALRVEDVVRAPEGLRVTIRQSKTDQEGRGQVVAIKAGANVQAVQALAAWTKAAGITAGPIFRRIGRGGHVRPAALTPQSVAAIVKRYAEQAGLDPSAYSGHSLRAGFLTSAAATRANLFKMADQSRHKSLDTLRGYVRDAELFTDHAGAGFM